MPKGKRTKGVALDLSAPQQSRQQEKRQDPSDGNWYTRKDFLDEYGALNGARAWDNAVREGGAPVKEVAAPKMNGQMNGHANGNGHVKSNGKAPAISTAGKRQDPSDGNFYTFKDFELEYGPRAMELWNKAKPEKAAGLNGKEAVEAALVDGVGHCIELLKGLTGKTAADRLVAVENFAALSEHGGRACEPYLLDTFPVVLRLVADKDKGVREAAEKAREAFAKVMVPISTIMPLLLAAAGEFKLQTKLAGIAHMKTLIARAPDLVADHLPEIIPVLSATMVDSKADVRTASSDVMLEACKVIDNEDVKPFVPALVSCMARPEEAADCVEQLSRRTFVQAVDRYVLSLLVPLLNRALREGSHAVKRQTCMIVASMSKAVDRPADVDVFLPQLLPNVQSISEDMPDPEIRSVATRTVGVLVGRQTEAKVEREEKKTLGPARDAAKVALATVATKHGVKLDKVSIDYIAEVLSEIVDRMPETTTAAGFKERVVDACAAFVAPVAGSTDAAAAFFHDTVDALLEAGYGVEKPIVYDPLYSIRLPNLILAFGQRVLLREAPLMMLRGHRYALFGQNGVGKTTLMTRMGAGDIRGFPTHLRSVYVKHEILTSPEVTVRQFVREAAEECGAPASRVEEALTEVGFPDELKDKAVAELSGGWRMRLALASVTLLPMDILLLDEPTNHLDEGAVDWLANFLLTLKETTVVVVSHDVAFLDRTVTDIIWMHDLQLSYYHESFSQFLANRRVHAKEAREERIRKGLTRENEEEGDPEMEAEGVIVPFKFPAPGGLDGVASNTRTVLKMKDVEFQYPNAPAPQLRNVSVRLTLQSRVAIVGHNGAGKSTLMNNLVGELDPTRGVGVFKKHPNLRVAYISQHSMHHLEKHKQATPITYIATRYRLGHDREQVEKDTLKLTPEELEMQKKRGNLLRIMGRRKKFGGLEYECRLVGREEPKWIRDTQLATPEYGSYSHKLMKQYDELLNASAAGTDTLSRSYEDIKKFLAGFGLMEENTLNKVEMLSGGQRSRLVLAAAMWNKPHLIALDEPTNYLDIEAMDSLAEAIKLFKGAVVFVSHNQMFVRDLPTEWWLVKDGTVTVHDHYPEGY